MVQTKIGGAGDYSCTTNFCFWSIAAFLLPPSRRNGRCGQNGIEIICMQLEFSWRIAGYSFELPAEVFHVRISALVSDFGDTWGTMEQIFLGQPNPAVDDIFHAGDAEGLFVNGLQIARADSERIRHFRNRPIIARVILNGCAKSI